MQLSQVHRRHDSKRTTTKWFAISVLMAAAVPVHVACSVICRWKTMDDLPIIGIRAILVLLVGLFLIANVVCIRDRHRWMRVAVFIAYIGCWFAAHGIGKDRAQAAIREEVDAAIEMGLQSDCERLLAQHEMADDEWFDERIYRAEERFKQLPASLRQLAPVYIVITNVPSGPNIGLCKDGFGGFSSGVRVFSHPLENFPAEDGMQISPTVFVCFNET